MQKGFSAINYTPTNRKRKPRHHNTITFLPPHILSTIPSSKSHHLLNLRNRLPRIQPLGTSPRAIQNSMAPIQTHAIIQRRLPLTLVFIPAVGEPAVGLQQDGGAEVLLAVPPVGRAGCAAAGAEDAFIEAVELFAVGGGLAVFAALQRFRISMGWVCCC